MTFKSIFLIAVFFVWATHAYAGDYELFIIDDKGRVCDGRKIHTDNGDCFEDAWRPICTTDEVIEELRSYFSGEEAKIKILAPAFGNGHVSFCSAESHAQVSQALREIQASGPKKRGRHLKDFIAVNQLQAFNKPPHSDAK